MKEGDMEELTNLRIEKLVSVEIEKAASKLKAVLKGRL